MFELLIQLVFTDAVSAPAYSSLTTICDMFRGEIKAYLDLAVLCNKLLLQDNNDDIFFHRMKMCILASRNSFSPEHIRTAVTLPCGHVVRKLFAQAAVKDFMLSRIKGQPPFKFETELKELEGFAADLAFACGDIFRDFSLRKTPSPSQPCHGCPHLSTLSQETYSRYPRLNKRFNSSRLSFDHDQERHRSLDFQSHPHPHRSYQ